MKNILLTFLAIISLGSLSAQTFVHSVNPFPSEKPLSSLQADTIKILAVMVDFQEDRDNTTFGNGKFGSIYSAENSARTDILDPLPHNKNYFEDHLTFAANYYKNVSNDLLNISFDVHETVLTVSQAMRNYSPDKNSTDLTPLGNFAQEVWQLFDQSNPAFDYTDYNMFLIFHAGVGRDVNLPGSIGNEKDLPSVYLGKKSLQKIFGEAFEGFPVGTQNFKINNTAILPSTESRELAAVSGTVLLELSINGLIVANIASFKGLPDLFDTETGLSAIGRFGLMDGQSIFAYGGTFPPEPSPWEKIQFGWIEPTVVEYSLNEMSLNLLAHKVAGINDTTLLKIPINQNEYYLVENKSRDAKKDGAVITYKSNGEIKTFTFAEDVDNFRSFDVDTLEGVVIDVDEFDWASPGNGIVIWHIDEKIIKEKLPSNSINADLDNRGVDIEEADGVQDIGIEFTTIFGDKVIGEGTDEDLWYSSNKSKLYENIFNADSKPNTNSNSGAASLISFEDFSDISNNMSFKLNYGTEKLNIISSQKLPWNESVSFLNAQKVNEQIIFYLISESRLDRINLSASVSNSFENFSDFAPAAVVLSDNEYVFGVKNNLLNVFRKTDNFELVSSFELNQTLSCPPVIHQKNENEIDIILGSANGEIQKINLNVTQSVEPDIANAQQVAELSGEAIKQLSVSESGEISAITENMHWQGSKTEYNFTGQLVKLISTTNKSGRIDIISDDKNKLYIISNNQIISEWMVPAESKSFTFSVADIFEDGNNYILYPAGNYLHVYNLSGSLADNFPFKDPIKLGFEGTPLAADINLDNKVDVLSFTNDGRIIGIDGVEGEIIDPFPVSNGAENITSPLLFDNIGVPGISASEGTFMATVSGQNIFSVWKIGDRSEKTMWAGEFGNNLNSGFAATASSSSPITTEFFPKKRAYNWPNPVYNNTTNFRYFVLEDSKIEIKIFDMAGDLVAELSDNAIGNFDNETVWNVADISSGVYFAHLEVTGVSGNSDKKIIKVAIIK